MCTHKKAQIELIKKGIPSAMAVRNYPERCPYQSENMDKEKVGAINVHYLEKLTVTDKIKKSKPVIKQSSLF